MERVRPLIRPLPLGPIGHHSRPNIPRSKLKGAWNNRRVCWLHCRRDRRLGGRHVGAPFASRGLHHQERTAAERQQRQCGQWPYGTGMRLGSALRSVEDSLQILLE